MPQWAFAIAFGIAGLLLMLWWSDRRVKKHAMTRPNLSETDFVALFPGREEDAREVYSFISFYLPKGVSPHPDDNPVKDLAIDEGDVNDWVLERLGLKEDGLLINYDLSDVKWPQTVADLVSVNSSGSPPPTPSPIDSGHISSEDSRSR